MTPTFDGLMGSLRGSLAGSPLSMRVACSPSPSHRPQVGKHGTYYAKSYQVCMAECLKQLAEQRPAVALTGDLGVLIEVVIARPKKTVRVRPQGDVDNYAKAPMDAATKAGVWGDDGQATALAVLKRWTEEGEEPGYRITIGELPCPPTIPS